jgi:hypothetical protein
MDFGRVAMLLCALVACGAQAADWKGGKPIEFTAPRSDEVTTNLHQLTSKKDSLKQLEEDLYQPLQSFNPKSSLEGVTAPMPRQPAPPLIQSKRAKDLLERRKNWVFMRPEDLVAEPTAQDFLKAPDLGTESRDKTDFGPLEQYYQRLATKHSVPKHPDQSTDDDLFGPTRKPNSGDETGAQNESDLPTGLKESTQALKNMFEADKTSDPSARGGTRSSFSDIFSLGGNTPSKAQVLEHKKYMDEYRSLVDPTWHPAAVPNPFSEPGLPQALQPTRSQASGFVSSSLATHHGLDAQVDVLNPLLGPPGLPDVNARALGQPRPRTALPTVETPKTEAPTFTAPKRASF